jgi:hypothetical protein
MFLSPASQYFNDANNGEWHRPSSNPTPIKNFGVGWTASAIAGCVLIWCRSCHLAELVCVLIAVQLVIFVILIVFLSG